MSPYIRKVKTGSGATAVQIVEKRSGIRRILEHLGSAHSEADLAALMRAAQDRLNAGQQAFDLGLGVAEPGTGPVPSLGPAVVAGTRCEVLWEVLSDAYAGLGFDALGDAAFKSMVLARIVEPASKLATIGILEDLGIAAPHRNTLGAALKRCQGRDYRDTLAKACLAHSVRVTGSAAMVMYDVTVRREALVVRAEVRDLCLIPCRSGGFEAGGSLIGETSGRAGAAPTKSCRVSTVGWRGRGEHAEEVYARNRCHHLS